MFNLAAGEIVVLLLLALIFFGPSKRPELATLRRARTAPPIAPPWSWSDWLLVCAAFLSGALALQLAIRD